MPEVKTGKISEPGERPGKTGRQGVGPRKIIQRGAEAVLYLDGGALVKERLRKGYRLAELDAEIRSQRTRKEARLLERARRAGVLAPEASVTGDCTITMDYIQGKRLKDVLNGMSAAGQDAIAVKIGDIVARLHSARVIHGDLTTSNMILRGGDVHVIDFGLGKVSEKVEDMATDLFLLKEALGSTHFGSAARLWGKIINTYAQRYSNAVEVISRLEKIEERRRYK